MDRSGGIDLDIHRRDCPDDLAGLMAKAPMIDYHRVKALKDVSIRLLAREVLCVESENRGVALHEEGIFHPLEMTREPVTLQPPGAAPATGKKWHLYVSPNNPGARELANELQLHCGSFVMAPIERYKSSQTLRPISTVARLPGLGSTLAQLPLGGLGRRGSARSEHSNSHAANGAKIAVCTDPNEMESCQHFLLYLNKATHDQSRPEVEALYAEIDEALDSGVHVLLAHETRPAKGGILFSDLIDCTPPEVRDEIDEKGNYIGKRLYKELAVGIADGAHLPTCLHMLLSAIAVVPDPEREKLRQATQVARRVAVKERMSGRQSLGDERDDELDTSRGLSDQRASSGISHDGMEERQTSSCDQARKLCARSLTLERKIKPDQRICPE